MVPFCIAQDMEELLAPEGAANRLSRQGSGLSRMLSLHRASSLPHSNRSSPATSPKSPKPIFLPSTHAEVRCNGDIADHFIN